MPVTRTEGGHRLNGHRTRILLVELPPLLRDIVRRGIEAHTDALVGEVDRKALDVVEGDPRDTTLVVWSDPGSSAAQWEPGRKLLAPSAGFRVLRLDQNGQSGVLFEMCPTARVLPELGLDLILRVIGH